MTETLMTLRFVLPWPPSVNHYYRTPTKGKLAGRTLISEGGRKFRIAALAAVRDQCVPTDAIRGRIAVSILACPPDRRRRDVDNMLKGILDSLHHARVICDDGDIDDLHIRRGAVQSGGEITIEIRELDGPDRGR